MAREDVKTMQFGKSLRGKDDLPRVDKKKVKENLKNHIDDYLAKGGKITKIPVGESVTLKEKAKLTPKAKKAINGLGNAA